MFQSVLCASWLVLGVVTEGIEGTYTTRAGTVEGTLQIAMAGPDQIRFDLELASAPNATFGILESQYATLKDGVADYRTPGTGACHMKMTFSHTEVRIEQLTSDAACGFGVGLTANGLWTREGALQFDNANARLTKPEIAELREMSKSFAEADDRLNKALEAFQKTLPRKSRKAFLEEQAGWMEERDARALQAGKKGTSEHLGMLIGLTSERALLLEGKGE